VARPFQGRDRRYAAGQPRADPDRRLALTLLVSLRWRWRCADAGAAPGAARADGGGGVNNDWMQEFGDQASGSRDVQADGHRVRRGSPQLSGFVDDAAPASIVGAASVYIVL
jgi:hypothetical protein